MLRSIRSRLIASYLLVILLAMGVAAMLAWNALDRAFLDVLRENLVAQARRVAQTVEAGDMSGLGTQPAPYSQAANVLPGKQTVTPHRKGKRAYPLWHNSRKNASAWTRYTMRLG